MSNMFADLSFVGDLHNIASSGCVGRIRDEVGFVALEVLGWGIRKEAIEKGEVRKWRGTFLRNR